MTTNVIGLFDSFDVAQDVVADLIDSGFTRDHISIVSQKAEEAHAIGQTNGADAATTGAVSGTVLGGTLGLLVGAGLLVIPGIGPVLAAGPLAAAIGSATAAVGAAALGAGLGAATGGLVGALVGEGVPEDEAHYYAEGVRRGGRLVVVRAESDEEGRARIIMQRHGAADIHKQAETWRADGWDAATTSAAKDEVARDWSDSSKVGTTVGTVSGATTGAVIGSVAGPVGTAVGGIVGAAAGAGVGAVGDVAGKHSEHTANGFEAYEPNFRSHYQSNYANSGYSYDQYAPYYQSGYDVAHNPAYANRDWPSIETSLRDQWADRKVGNWEQFKDAVRYAWDQARRNI